MAAGTLVLTIILFMIVPKGFFPVEDTGVIHGHFGGRPVGLLFGHGGAPAGAFGRDPQGPGRGEPLLLHRHRRHQPTLNSGRILINLKPLAERKMSATDVIRRLQPEWRRWRGITLYMQPVQDLTVDARVSRTQFQYTIEDPDAKELYSGRPSSWKR